MPKSSKLKTAQAVQTYIVTEDLSILVPRWCKQLANGKPFPCDEKFFDGILAELRGVLQRRCFPPEKMNVVTLRHGAFDDLLQKPMTRRSTRTDEIWITLDDVYPRPQAETESKFNLSITRYVDREGKDLEQHGPRPELTTEHRLAIAIRECASKLPDDSPDRLPLVLVDDGTFKGHTITDVLNEFATLGVFIERVRLGVARNDGVTHIAGWAKEANGKHRQVSFIGASKLCPPINDWICERDFFPGVLYAGKVVATVEPQRNGGSKTGGRRPVARPLRIGKVSKPVRAQYLYDWGNPSEWAGIPEDSARSFTYDVLGITIRLWERIEKWLKPQLKRPVLVRDLPAVPLRFCVEVSERSPDAIEKALDERWIDVLESERRKLKGYVES